MTNSYLCSADVSFVSIFVNDAIFSLTLLMKPWSLKWSNHHILTCTLLLWQQRCSGSSTVDLVLMDAVLSEVWGGFWDVSQIDVMLVICGYFMSNTEFYNVLTFKQTNHTVSFLLSLEPWWLIDWWFFWPACECDGLTADMVGWNVIHVNSFEACLHPDCTHSDQD